MEILISNSSDKPIYEQICIQIKSMIMDGTLSAGETLPSMRALAKDLHISVITVQRAYEDLTRDGFIETVSGKGSFVAAQASVVATMISGIPSIPAFVIGLIAGLILHCVKAPAMMIGLGIYLPFYMSFTAFLGAMAKVVYDAITKARRRKKQEEGLDDEGAQVLKKKQDESGLVVASGLLGGESIVGVLVALSAVVMGMGA